MRGYLFSIGMYLVGVSWIYVSIHLHGGAPPVLAATLVMLFVFGISIVGAVQGYLYVRFLSHLAWGVGIGFAVAWSLREWTFTWILTGFPWLFAGYGHLATPLAGFVPIIGVLGVGLLVAITAAVPVMCLRDVSHRARGVAVLGIAAIWLAGWALQSVQHVEKSGDPISVSLVQGNIDQRVKWTRAMVVPIIGAYQSLTRDEWGRDLVIWPEAAITLFRESAKPNLARWQHRASVSGTTLVLGIPDRNPEGGFLNTAIALGQGEGQYIKRRLVPFGEFVPLEGLLRGLITFFDLPMSRNQSGPDNQPPLMAGGLLLSLSICYEVVYPEIVRQTAEAPDLLVTISNDSWFGDSIGPYQHLEMAQARALENGRYLVRSTNNGITAIVDPAARLVDRLPRFEPGVLRGDVWAMSGTTPYHRYGNLPLLAILVLGAGICLVIHWRHVSGERIG